MRLVDGAIDQRTVTRVAIRDGDAAKALSMLFTGDGEVDRLNFLAANHADQLDADVLKAMKSAGLSLTASWQYACCSAVSICWRSLQGAQPQKTVAKPAQSASGQSLSTVEAPESLCDSCSVTLSKLEITV